MDNKYTRASSPKPIIDFEALLTNKLGAFYLDQQEYVILQLEQKLGLPEEYAQSLTEICRFEVNGYDCVILKILSQAENDELNPRVILSSRELQIAALVALGSPNKQVADKLGISEWTVATYLRRIYAKLQVESRAAMTYRCASLIHKQETVIRKI